VTLSTFAHDHSLSEDVVQNSFFDEAYTFCYVTPDQYENKVFGKEWLLCTGFLTPNGEMIGNPPYFDNKESEDKWVEKLRELLEKYKDCAMFIVDCDS